jgi:hypothetical protein
MLGMPHDIIVAAVDDHDIGHEVGNVSNASVVSSSYGRNTSAFCHNHDIHTWVVIVDVNIHISAVAVAHNK